MKKIIILSSLVISIALSAQKKYDFHPEFDEIVNRAETLAFVKKDYISAIELYKSVINTNGDYEDLLRCKFNCYKFLGSIYKSIDFEGHDFNLAYVYLKKAVEARDVFYKKAGFKSNYTSENDDLARRIDMLVKEYPGCENGTYVAQKNASTNTKSPINDVQNSSISSSNTQIDKPIANQEIKSDSTKQITKPTTERTVTITVSGSGKSQDEAKQSALRSAIEQAFGTFISAKTEILNDQVISDQITTVASGNIQAYDVLNESQLPDGTWGVTLKAIVSIDKLTSFVEAKGVVSEFKGGLFAINIKQQILNEEAEFKAICNMISIIHEPMQTAFDYSITTGEPKSMDSENKDWEIPLLVTVTANNNMKICSDYILNTLKSISLTDNELESYKKLNKQIFPIRIYLNGERINLYLRKGSSIIALNSFTSLYDFYVRCFKVQSIETNIKTESVCPEKESKFKIGPICDCPFDSEGVVFNTFLIRLFQSGEEITSFSWKDYKSLSQIEQIQKYTVEPTGIQSKYGNGGFVVTDENGHGFVLSLFDIDLKASSHWVDNNLYFEIHGFINNEMASTILNGYSFNGYNDWRIPNVLEMKIIQDKLIKKGFLLSRIHVIGGNDSNNNDYFCFDKVENKITTFLLLGKREWAPNEAHFRPVRSF